MNAQVIDTLMVKLVGDSSHYKRTITESKAATAQYTRDVNGYFRDSAGRFASAQNLMQREARQTENALVRLSGAARTTGASIRMSLGGVKGQLLAALGAGSVTGLLGKSILDASNAQESVSKFNSVFAGQAAEASKFVETLAKDIGRSKQEIRSAMSAYQSLFVGLGYGGEKALDMSQALQKLTLDFAAFHNISDEESMSRFISAMSGSAEVLDQFGVNIRQSAIEQELLAMGVKKSAANASEAEKTMARLNIILEAMGRQGAIGAAARESESFANQLKGFRAEVQELSIAVGSELLPVATDYVKQLKEMIGATTGVGVETSGLKGSFLTVADVLHTVAIGFSSIQAAITSTVAVAASALNRLSNLSGINPNDPMGRNAGWIANAGIKSALGPLGLLLPGAGETGAYAEELNRAAAQQRSEAYNLAMGPTPSELAAQREADKLLPKAPGSMNKFMPDATGSGLDTMLMRAARSFGHEVVQSGQVLGLKLSNIGTGLFADAVNLYNTPELKDSFAKATAGDAIRFGSAESELSRSQKIDDEVAKNTQNIAINTEASKRLQQKATDVLVDIGKALSKVHSIPN